MKKKRNVIATSALPTRAPTIFTVVMWLVLDRLQSPGWVSGVVWTLVALMWLGWVASAFQEQTRELPGFGNKD